MPKEASEREDNRYKTFPSCTPYKTRELSKICSDLHCHITETMAPMQDDQFLYDMETLKTALEHWKPADNPAHAAYDDAQKNLIVATLAECELHLAKKDPLRLEGKKFRYKYPTGSYGEITSVHNGRVYGRVYMGMDVKGGFPSSALCVDITQVVFITEEDFLTHIRFPMSDPAQQEHDKLMVKKYLT